MNPRLHDSLITPHPRGPDYTRPFLFRCSLMPDPNLVPRRPRFFVLQTKRTDGEAASRFNHFQLVQKPRNPVRGKGKRDGVTEAGWPAAAPPDNLHKSRITTNAWSGYHREANSVRNTEYHGNTVTEKGGSVDIRTSSGLDRTRLRCVALRCLRSIARVLPDNNT